MKKLPLLILRKDRLGIMIDFLNELASGTSSDQSQEKIDLVEELERLRGEMADLENEIKLEQKLEERRYKKLIQLYKIPPPM